MSTEIETRPTTERDKALINIFITALEGGIGYWSRCYEYHWTKDGTLEGEDTLGFYAVIGDLEDRDADLMRIDREVIELGVERFIQWAKVPGRSRYFKAAAGDLFFENWGDLDIDGDIADAIVQLALFNDLIYG